MLMVSPATVRLWSQRGDLESVTTPGGHRRYLHEHIDAFARQRQLHIAANDDNSKLRVLIVDDDKPFASYLQELLSYSPQIAETQCAYDGYSAGSLVYKFKPHVVLLDLKMPNIDGFGVCEDLKSGHSTKDIRVIAMSGYYSKENVQRILAAGVEACLKKPFEPSELFAVMGVEAGE
jgi:CheY-like chemotaxis protein